MLRTICKLLETFFPKLADFFQRTTIFVKAFSCKRYNVKQYRAVGHPTVLDYLDIDNDEVSEMTGFVMYFGIIWNPK
jgi:hypothetical protein